MNNPAAKKLISLTLLAMALLACLATGPNGAATPTASFTTATPGGSISISLLTPTVTVPGAANPGVMIGSFATATAEAAALLAETATAQALIPTPTVAGVFTEPALCPAPGTPTLPDESPSFPRYAELIAEYLSAGGATTVLEGRLRTWNSITDYGGLVIADRDFTGDGVPEVLITMYDPQSEDVNPQPGNLFVFGCDEGIYRLLHQAGYSVDRGAPVLHSADDINGDQLNDMVYSVETCGETSCVTDVKMIEWSMPLENFQSLVSQAVIQPYAQVVVSDVDEDQLDEVSVTSGVIGQLEAGPQRQITSIYKWDGTVYTLAETIKPIAEYRIHVIHDGDEALMAEDYSEAITQYRKAITSDRLLSWSYPGEDLYLRAFGRYRLMLAYVRAGNLGAAQQAHDELIQVYTMPPPPAPSCDPAADPLCTPVPTATPYVPPGEGLDFARMADLFWLDYSVNRNLRQSCNLVVGYARSTPLALDVLNSFGYANRQYTAIDMCPWSG